MRTKFKTMARLITEIEAINHSPAGVGFPRKFICENLDLVEEEFTRDCLGDDLFDYLVGKLTDVSTAMEWEPCNAYALDTLVFIGEAFYKSTASDNDTDPRENGTPWTSVNKFTDACCNTLWTKYLRRILAYKVYYYALPFATNQSGAGGLTIQETDGRGTRSARPAEVDKSLGDVLRVVNTSTVNMIKWLDDTDQSACGFPSRVCGEGCETESTNTNDRFWWG